MKIVLSLALLATLAAVRASDGQQEFLVRQAGATVDVQDIDAIAGNIPDDLRFGVMDDPNRIAGYLNTIVLQRAVAAEARAHGVDQDPLVQREIQIMAEKILAKHYVDRAVAALPEPDYEQLSKETYLANRDQYKSPDLVDVSHILISSKKRGEEPALARAREVRQKLVQEPAALEALVAEYSDDPSAGSNRGRFSHIMPGRMVPEFEKVAFSLEPGEISEPVKTKFGYHVITLHSKTPGSQRPFDEVKKTIIAELRARQNEQMRSDFLDKFRNQPMEVNEEGVLALRTRYAEGSGESPE